MGRPEEDLQLQPVATQALVGAPRGPERPILPQSSVPRAGGIAQNAVKLKRKELNALGLAWLVFQKRVGRSCPGSHCS